MKNGKLGQEPAFGDKAFYNHSTNCVETSGMYFGEVGCGMSKRFYAACAAMNGLLSNGWLGTNTEKEIIKNSFEMADELLRQEDL